MGAGRRTLTRATAALILALSVAANAQVLLQYDFSNGSGTTVTDLSGQGDHGTLVSFGDTSAGAGVFGVSEGWVTGGGLSFLDDGIRSFVQTPLSQSAVNGGDFTIEFIASADGPADWTPAIGSTQNPYSTGETFFLGIDNGLARFEARVPNDGGGVGTPDAPIPWTLPGDQSDPTPHHVALTYTQATGRFTCYVDGAVAGTETRAALAPAASNFIVGNTGHSAGEQWDGIISGVAISDAELQPTTFVLAHYAPPVVSTLLHYDFSNGSGTTVTDLSGHGNDGTLMNFGDTSPGAGVFGVNEGWVDGGGVSFLDDGVRSYIQTPLSQSAINGGSFTIEFIASADGPAGWTPVIGSDQASFNAAESFFLGIDSNLTRFEARVPSDGGGIGAPDALIPWLLPGDQTDDILHHVALVYDTNTNLMSLYIDELLAGSEARSPTGATSNFIIGNSGHSSSEQWDGIVSAVAFSDGVLGPGTFYLLREPEVLIPEPATLSLLGIGGFGLLARRRRRKA